MENIEIVQQHEIQDIYRIAYGVLVKINKFKRNEYCGWYWATTNKYKKQMTKIKEIKNCFRLTEDCICKECVLDNWEDVIIPKGTIIFEDSPIEVLGAYQKDDWFYELKTTGSSFSGDLEEFRDLINRIDKIVDSY